MREAGGLNTQRRMSYVADHHVEAIAETVSRITGKPLSELGKDEVADA